MTIADKVRLEEQLDKNYSSLEGMLIHHNDNDRNVSVQVDFNTICNHKATAGVSDIEKTKLSNDDRRNSRSPKKVTKKKKKKGIPKSNIKLQDAITNTEVI